MTAGGQRLALLQGHSRDSVLAWWQGRAVSAGEFLCHVELVAAGLPSATAAVNLCEDRYLFLVTFAALLLRGQVNLLPPNRAPQAVAEVAAEYPGSYYLAEQPLSGMAPAYHCVALPPEPLVAAAFAPPQIAANQLVAVLFTSGTTGRPNPAPKQWGELVAGSTAARTRFGLAQCAGGTVVATVPSQHMFGLETTVLFPLLGGLAVHGGRPFFPEDLRRAIDGVPAPRVLITTPLHLRACVEAGLVWPSLARVISATAPLVQALALQAEQVFGCAVEEIYGSTETGAVASRRTAREDAWQPLNGVVFSSDGAATWVDAPFLPRPVALNDIIELLDDGRLRLLGRHADMVNIAGKRASLGDLTHKLLQIPGVEDAVIFQSEVGGGVERLCALVVAPQVDASALQQEMLQRFDPVFVPRPLYRVAQLPRNAAGKLPRHELLALLQRLRERHGTDE